MSANGVDFLAGVLIVVPLASGVKDGLVSGLMRGLGLVAACALAIWKMSWLSDRAAHFLGLSSGSAPIAVLAAALLLGWLLGMAAGWAWKKLSTGSVSWADRMAGGALGAAKGAAIALVVVSIASIASPGFREAARRSWLGEHAAGPVFESGHKWLESRLRSWRTPS